MSATATTRTARLVLMTPEPRVEESKMIFPEAEMTRKALADVEAAFNAPIRDEWGRVR
jgi:hypothetical protein